MAETDNFLSVIVGLTSGYWRRVRKKGNVVRKNKEISVLRKYQFTPNNLSDCRG